MIFTKTPEQAVHCFFASAGIVLNGTNSYDIKVNDKRFYSYLARRGALGLGEAYMEGFWDCDDLTTMCAMLAQRPSKKKSPYLKKILYGVKAATLNLQDLKGAKEVTWHYNLSNELYKNMLDHPHMQYSSAIFKSESDTLEEAQQRKMQAICQKLDLQPGDRVLEIGGGWGGLAVYMVKNFGVHVTSLNISREQIKHARENQSGLPIQTIEMDYRFAPELGTFDKIVSIEMLEAVGAKNYRTYMECIHACLKPNGLALIQTIGDNTTRLHGNLWILKYIFPNGHIPSLAQIGKSIEKLLVIEQIENYGECYAQTLDHWQLRFNNNWDSIRNLSPRFDERFYRMWNYYLGSSAGAFRAKHLVLWQILMSRPQGGRSGISRSVEYARGNYGLT